MKKNSGFTLIELLVVIAILGILFAIAVPQYSQYVIRGKLVEATTQLSDLRVRLEQYYQDNRNYGSTAAACVYAMPVAGSNGVKYFSYACKWDTTVSSDNQSFIITANSLANVGLGAAADYVFTINSQNNRQTTAFTGASGLPLTCWVTSKGQTSC